ncbi:MAG: formylglycine-generating enzyme family protein, partial [Pseudomonadota bacterium]
MLARSTSQYASAALGAMLAALVATAAPGAELDMVPIPAGPFLMGANDGPADQRPADVVEVEAFAIDPIPVTNHRFAEFLSAVGPVDAAGRDRFDVDDPDARIHRLGARFLADPGYGDHPVVEATWFGARDYCRRRGARLPSEAEWEKAARGAAGRTYPWGEAPPDRSRAQFGAGYNATAPAGAHPAGATPEGVLDMAGNVHQWVSSLYRPYPYRSDDGRENPDAPGERVTRGGAHDSGAGDLSSAWRGRGTSRSPERGHHNIGFRCARSLGP